MGQDASKVLLGQTRSSFKTVDNIAGSAVIAAGTVVHLKTDGTPSVAHADGAAIGVSLGADLSGGSKVTAVCRRGTQVPLLLESSFTPAIGDAVNIKDTTGKGVAAGSGATAVNAIYASSTMTGVDESGVEVNVALIDMPGGL